MNKKILIVEPYEGVRKLAKTILQDAGYDVIEAVNAEDALTKLSRFDVHMILTGFMLPDMDGIEMTRTLRSQTFYHNTPVTMMTTYNTAAVKDKAIKAGISDLIPKPFKARELIKLAENWINRCAAG